MLGKTARVWAAAFGRLPLTPLNFPHRYCCCCCVVATATSPSHQLLLGARGTPTAFALFVSSLETAHERLLLDCCYAVPTSSLLRRRLRSGYDKSFLRARRLPVKGSHSKSCRHRKNCVVSKNSDAAAE